MNKNSFLKSRLEINVKKEMVRLAQANYKASRSRDQLNGSHEPHAQKGYSRLTIPTVSEDDRRFSPKGATKEEIKRSYEKRAAARELCGDIASAAVLVAGAVVLIIIPLLRFYLNF